MSRSHPSPDLAMLVDGPWLEQAATKLARRYERRWDRRAAATRAPRWTADRLRTALGRGAWRPRPPREVQVPKRRGGWRLLTVYEPEEQVVHSALQLLLTPWFERRFLDSSWGFRPRRSVRQAARRAARALAAGRTWAVDLDLEDCFGTVRHDLLLGQLEAEGVTDGPLLELIGAVVHVGAGWRRGRQVGLAQGSPLSPLLANVHLHPVDVALRDLAAYQRFADDLVCLETNRDEAERAWERMVDAVAERGQAPSPRKSGVRLVEPGWRYLGYVVNEDGHLEEPQRVGGRRRVLASRRG